MSENIDQQIQEARDQLQVKMDLLIHNSAKSAQPWQTSGEVVIDGTRVKIAMCNIAQLRDVFVHLYTRAKNLAEADRFFKLCGFVKSGVVVQEMTPSEYNDVVVFGYTFKKWSDDLLKRYAEIKLQEERAEIETLQKRLASIMSEDAKRKNELDSILSIVSKK